MSKQEQLTQAISDLKDCSQREGLKVTCDRLELEIAELTDSTTIAEALHISLDAVQRHVERAFKNLANNRGE